MIDRSCVVGSLWFFALGCGSPPAPLPPAPLPPEIPTVEAPVASAPPNGGVVPVSSAKKDPVADSSSPLDPEKFDNSLSAQTVAGNGFQSGLLECFLPEKPVSLADAKLVIQEAFASLTQQASRIEACSIVNPLTFSFSGASSIEHVKGAGSVNTLLCVANAVRKSTLSRPIRCTIHDFGPADAVALDPDATSIAGQNITMGSVSANGISLKDLVCRSSGGGLFGALAVPASLAQKKAGLRACGAHATTNIAWRAAGGKITEVAANGASGKCVQKVLKGAAMGLDGECRVTLLPFK